MKQSPHPWAVVVLAILWPLVTLAFAIGLTTQGRDFGVPDWFHDALKPLGVVAWVVASFWIYAQVRGRRRRA